MAPHTSLLARAGTFRGALDLLIRTLIFSFIFSLIPVISAPPARAQELPNEITLRKVSDTRFNLSMNLLDQYTDQEISVRIRRISGGTSQIITLPSKKLGAEGKVTVPITQKLEKDDVLLFVIGNKVIYKENFADARIIDLTGAEPTPSPSPTAVETAPVVAEVPNEIAFRKVNEKRYNLSMNLLDRFAGRDLIVERVRGGVTTLIGRLTLRVEGRGAMAVNESLADNDLFIFRSGNEIVFSQKFSDARVIDLTAPTPSPSPKPTASPSATAAPIEEYPNEVAFKEVNKKKYYLSMNLFDRYANKQIVVERRRNVKGQVEVVRYPPKTLRAEGKATITISEALLPADDFLFRFRGKVIFKQNFGTATLLVVKDGKLIPVRTPTPAPAASATPTPTPTPSINPTPTATPTPSITPTPTPTPTRAPIADTSTPVSSGGGGGSVFVPVVNPPVVVVRYSVTFDSNTAETGTVPTSLSNKNSGDVITLPTPDTSLVKSGYRFLGWNFQADGMGDFYFPGEPFTVANANRTFYAIWTDDDWKIVKYFANGPNQRTLVAAGRFSGPLLGASFSRSGYRLASWNTQALGGGTSYSLSSTYNFSADLELFAQWETNEFTVTVITPVGGSITPSTRVKNYDSSETFTATASSGYHFVHWLIDGTVTAGSTTYVLTNIRANKVITALFEVDTFTVTVTPPTNGSISPGTVVKNFGSSETFTATPSIGYRLVNWTVDGVNAGSSSTLALTNIRANRTVAASFVLETFTITVTPTTGGTISPGTVVKNYGTSETFTATPAVGYRFLNWTVDGQPLGTGAPYLFESITANHTITATFQVLTFTVTVTQATGGTISPSTVVKNYGSTETFTAVLTPGYRLLRWVIDGAEGGSNLIRVLNNITADRSITAVYELETFTVTVNQPTGGSISPLTGAKNYGSTETYTATANQGYHFVRWVVNGSFIDNPAPYVLSNITGINTITAQFELDTFTVTVVDPANGSISPGSSTKNYGSTETYTAIADTGYRLGNWVLDGVNVGSSPTYVLSDIRANKSLTAVFVIETFTVTVTQAPNGSISADAAVVNYGETVTITATPTGGFVFSYWIINGVNVSAVAEYVLGPITSNQTISAVFALDVFGITVVQPANGSISPGSYTPTYGSSETFTATPNIGYRFVKWVIDGNDVFTPGTYVLSNITTSHTISATFAIETFTITVIQPNFGRVSPGTVIKNYGSTETYTAIADTGYHLNRWFKDGSYLPAAPNLVIENIREDHSVSAEFVIDTFTVTVNQNTGGTISPASDIYNYGSTETFTVTLAPGYHLEEWFLDGVSQGNSSTLVLSNISASYVVTATYDRNIYPITVVQPVRGSITPSSFNAYWGDSETFTVTVNSGYHLSHWEVDGINVGGASTYVLSNIQSAETITAVIVIDTFTITVVQGDYGTITPGTTVVEFGSTETFTAVADSGYRLKYWEIDGVNSGSETRTVLTEIAADVTITAVFEADIPEYSVTYHLGEAAGDAPVDSTRYRQGASFRLLSPDSATLEGFAFAGWSTDPQDFGTIWGASSAYEMGISDLNFYAFWKRVIPVYFIYDSSTVTLGGETTTSVLVMEDDIITPIFEAADGYVISRFTVNGVPTAAYVNGQLSDNPNSIRADLYLGPIRETLTVVVTTEPITGHTVTYLANNGPNSISLDRVNLPDAYTVEDFGWTHYDSNLHLVWYEDSYGDTYRVGDVINLSGPETLTAIYRELIPFTVILENPESNTLTFDGILLDAQNPQHTFMVLPGRDFTVTPAPVAGQRVARFVASLYNDIWEDVPSVQINWYELEDTFTITFESFAFTRVYYMPLEDYPELDVTDYAEYQPGDVITFLEAGNRGRVIGTNAITVSWFEGPFDGSREFRPGETLTADLYDLYLYPLITDYREVAIRPQMNFYQDSISEESLTVSFNVPLLFQEGQDYLVAVTDDLVVSIQVSDEYRIMYYSTYSDEPGWYYSPQVVETRTTVNIGENLGNAQIEITLDRIPYGWEFNAFGSGSESDTEVSWDDGFGSRWNTPDYYFDLPNNQASRYWVDQNQVRHEPDVNEPLSGDSSFTLYPEMESFNTLEIIVNDPSRGEAWLDIEGDRDYDNDLYAVFIGESATIGIGVNSGETLTGAMLNGEFIPVEDFILNYIEQYDYEYYTYTIETITSRTTFEAIFVYTPYNYTVNFAPDGGVGSQSGFSGTEPTFVMPAIQFTKSGYTASCWKEESSFLWAIYCTGDRVTVADFLPATVFNFYPNWERVPYSYTVTLNPGYGSGAPVQSTSGSGFAFTVPAANESDYSFVRDGWKMIGWNTAADMSGTRHEAGDQAQVYSETPTLYAEWVQCYDNDCSSWDSKPRSEVFSVGLEAYDFVGEASAASHTSVGVHVRYPSFREIAGDTATVPYGLKFIGWNSNPNPDQGRWHLPGDSIDAKWWNSETTFSGLDLDAFDDTLHAFFSPTCTTYLNCDDIYAAVLLDMPSESYSVISGGPRYGNFVKLGETATVLFNFQRGYGVTSAQLFDSGYYGGFTNLSVDQAFLFYLDIGRLRFNVEIVYLANLEGQNGPGGTWNNLLEHVIEDYEPPSQTDFAFIGWATTIETATAGIVEYVAGDLYPVYSADPIIFYPVFRSLIAQARVSLSLTAPELGNTSEDYISINGAPFGSSSGEYRIVLGETETLAISSDDGQYIIDYILINGETATYTDGPVIELDLGLITGDVDVQIFVHHRLYNYQISYSAGDPDMNIADVVIAEQSGWVKLAGPELFGVQIANIESIGLTPSIVTGWNFEAPYDGYAGEVIELYDDNFNLTATARWAPGYKMRVVIEGGEGGSLTPINLYGQETITQSTDVYGLYDQPREPIFGVTTAPGYTLSSITYNGEELLGETYPGTPFPLYGCEDGFCYINIDWDRIRQNETLTVTFTRPYDYRLTFDANGGLLANGETTTPVIGTGSAFTYPANRFARSGYRFNGWTRTGDRSTVREVGETETLRADVNWTLYANWEPNLSGTAVVYSPGIGAGETQTIYLETPDFILPELPSLTPVGDLYPAWWLRGDGTRQFPGETLFLTLNGSNYDPETFTVAYLERIPLTLILANPESGTLTFGGVLLNASNPSHTFLVTPGTYLRIEPTPASGLGVESYRDAFGDFGMPWPYHERTRYLGAGGNLEAETITITFGLPMSQVIYFTEEEMNIELPIDDRTYSPGDVITLATLGDYGINDGNPDLIEQFKAITGWRVHSSSGISEYEFGDTVTAGLYSIGASPVFTEYLALLLDADSEETQTTVNDLTATFNQPVYLDQTFIDGDQGARGYAAKLTPNLTASISARPGLEIIAFSLFNVNGDEIDSGTVYADSFTITLGNYESFVTLSVYVASPTLSYRINVLDEDNQPDVERSLEGRWSYFYAPTTYIRDGVQQMVSRWEDEDGNQFVPGRDYPIPYENYQETLTPIFTDYVTVDFPASVNGYFYVDYLVGIYDYANQNLTLPIGESFTVAVNPNEGFVYTGLALNGISYFNRVVEDDGNFVFNSDAISQNTTVELDVVVEETEYEVTFDFNGGVDGPAGRVGSSNEFEFPDNYPTRAGYNFVGWRDTNFSNDVYQAGGYIDITGNFPYISFNFVAVWERATYDYSITFDPGYGTGPGATVTGTGNQFELNYQAFESLTVNDPIIRNGWQITGWNSRADMSGTSYDVTFAFDLYSDSYTVFAEWTKCYEGDCSLADNRPPYGGLTFTPEFRVDYQETTTVSTYYEDGYVRMPTMQELLGSGYNRTGAQFIGWNSEADGEGDWFLPGDRYDTWMGDQVLGQGGFDRTVVPPRLYAFYSTTCSVAINCDDISVPIRFTFDSNITSVTTTSTHSAEYFPWGPSANFQVNYQAGYCLNSITRDGVTFGGSLETLTVDRAMNFNLTSTRCTFDLTLYLYDSSTAGTPEGSYQGTLSDLVIDFPNPTRTDYTFMGWATTPNGSPTYQRGSTIMLTSDLLQLYAIWRYNFVRVSFNIMADQDPILEDVLLHIGIDGAEYEGPLWIPRGNNGYVSQRFSITPLDNSTRYILDSVTVGSTTTFCESAACDIVELIDIDTNVVVNVYAHHAIFNYSITYVGVETVTVSGSGPSVTIADPSIFRMISGIADNGTRDGFAGSWASDSGWWPAGYRFALEGEYVDTLTAVWAAGYEVEVSVANQVGGTVRWVYPPDVANYPEPIFSTRTSQFTYWFHDQLPHLPYFKVEADPGYEIYSIKFRGAELIDSIHDATYRGGGMVEPNYQCQFYDVTECYFTLAELSDRVTSGDLVFEFKQQFSYSFAFDAGGGVLVDGENDNTQTGTATRYFLPETPYAKEGHDFMGWRDSSGQVSRLPNFIDITEDTFDTLTAVWQIQSFAVNFAGNENAPVTSTSNYIGAYDYGSSETFVVTPNPGFCVGGAIDVNGQATLNSVSYEASRTFTIANIRSDLTITIEVHDCAHQFSFNQYRNVGDGTGVRVDVATDRYFNIPGTPSQPSGARFLHWAANADGSGESYTAGQLIDLNTESFTVSGLYGQWALSIVINNADMNNDDASTPAITTNLDSFIQSKSCSYLENGSELTPYSANNWPLGNFAIRCSSFALIPGSSLESGFTVADATLNIHVHRYNYSITFNTGDAGTTVAPRSGFTHQIVLPVSAGDYPGYTFMGWSLMRGGSVIPNGFVALSSDFLGVTLHAIWQLNLSDA